MSLKFLTLCVLFVTIASLVSADLRPPQWVEDEPWIPHYVECEFTEEHIQNPESCFDCNSVMHCTPIGGFVRSCFREDEPYCNQGKCSAQISEECAELNPVVPESLESNNLSNDVELDRKFNPKIRV